jgi:tRNA pseudouridine55 synthase
MVIGKATRLAKFLSTDGKSYEATIRFGFATDTADAEGQPLGPRSERPMPSRDEIDAALDAFRGTFMQQPPAFSAKKIDGQRSYALARKARAPHAAPSQAAPSHSAPTDLTASDPAPRTPQLAPCRVTTTRVDILAIAADTVTLSVDCSAGFFIRSLAHDLGERLGVGAHLAALRRTRVGDFSIDRALTLDAAEREPQTVTAALMPLAAMLPHLGSITLTTAGVARALHGQDIRPIDQEGSEVSRPPYDDRLVRLLNASGELVAIAAQNPASGALHPSVVLV